MDCADKKHKCFCKIGILYDTQGAYEVSVDTLISFLAREKEIEEIARVDPVYCKIYYSSKYRVADYLDRRCSTNLRRYKYCPDCGKEIDWDALKRQYARG